MFQRQAAFDQVQMRIVEAWQYGRPLRVDHHRLGALQSDDLAVAADFEDLVGTNSDRFRGFVGGLAGKDHGVVDDQINRAVTVVTLGPNDQSCDQRHPDDANHEVGGEACGHSTLRS